jgi:hypothetical protein
VRHRCHLLRSSLDDTHPKSKHTFPLPPSLKVGRKHIESILGTCKNMTKKVFNLNNMIPHSVRLVNPFQDNLTQYQGSKGHSATSDDGDGFDNKLTNCERAVLEFFTAQIRVQIQKR